MARTLWLSGLVLAAGSLAGCISGPAPGNPVHVQPAFADVENPLFVPQPQGATGYNLVFDRVYDVLQERFDIARSNRFDGRILTAPRVSGGYADLPHLTLYDHYENLESTLQTIRRRAEVIISTADSGGYLIDVRVYKELEDLPQPIYSGTGAAVFRYESPIERVFEVVDQPILTHGWIPIGRDHALEQVLLAKIKGCL